MPGHQAQHLAGFERAVTVVLADVIFQTTPIIVLHRMLEIADRAVHDHVLVNVTLLADPAHRGLGLRAVYGETQLRAVHSGEALTLRGPVESIVTLVPIRGDVRGVMTHGLRYPLAGGLLPFGKSLGLSNVVASLPARVSIEQGVLLVIEIAKEEPHES
jgi:thiamine pyrophosphokinase